MNNSPNSNIVIYQMDDGTPKIDVKFENETVWLTQSQIASLFACSIDNVGLHLKNIFNEGELDVASTTEEFSVVRPEGDRMLNTKHRH